MKFSLLLIIFLLATSSFSQAGWVSGGGELIEDARNPWFVKNTTEVRYCIWIDEANFGQNIAAVRRRIQKALDFWKVQFQNTIDSSSGVTYGLATQTFTEVNCNQDPDIQFQFGMLSGEQMSRIGNPKHHIGLTVRTDYDKIHLKGKGFVYISPQEGPLQLDFLNKEGLSKEWKPWSQANGALLLPALIHEIGHIFGLGHDSDIFLMGERDLEKAFEFSVQGLTVENLWRDLENNNSLSEIRVFRIENSGLRFSSCFPVARPSPSPTLPKPIITKTKLPSIYQKFFNLQNDETCLDKEFKNNSLTLKTTDGGGNERIIGTAELTSSTFPTDLKGVVNLWLNKENVVFDTSNSLFWNNSIIWLERSRKFKGRFVFADKKASKPISIFMRSYGNMEIGGELNGQTYMNLEEGF